MAYPLDRRLLLPTYLCFYMFLTTCTLRSAALSFSYNFSNPDDLDNAELNCINDCYRDRAAGRIILTNNATTLRTGWVIHKQLVPLWDDGARKKASFNTTFDFAIRGNDNYERGDGMAFFIGPQDRPSDSHGAYLGLFNSPDGSQSQPPLGLRTVGVEFDTHRNDGLDPPSPCVDHIGIDVNSITSNNSTRVSDLHLFGHMRATIRYDADSGKMEATLILLESADSNPTPYTVSTAINLKDAGVPQEAAVGFSATTGNETESHELLSWSFESFNSTDTGTSKSNLWWVVLVSVAASVLLAGSVAALLYQRVTRRPSLEEPVLPVARRFSYSELSRATDNFSEERKLGEGAFGEVYRGDLPDPRMPQVAVKKLIWQPDSVAARNDFENEIMTLGQLRHRNLVRLVGWCAQADFPIWQFDVGHCWWWRRNRLLVYELVINGSVHDHLHGPARLLTWPERYRIVLGIGSAIEYLHTGNDKCILHRDIKPSNVLLDDMFEAKVSDFGLVRQVPREQRSQRITTAGCLPYMDPEAIATGRTSTASDVYSFGVLLLEIATGREPTVLEANDRLRNTLIDVVGESNERNAVLEMADERLNGEFDMHQMERLMNVGLLCVQRNRGDRPSIRDTIDLLSNLERPVPGILV